MKKIQKQSVLIGISTVSERKKMKIVDVNFYKLNEIESITLLWQTLLEFCFHLLRERKTVPTFLRDALLYYQETMPRDLPTLSHVTQIYRELHEYFGFLEVQKIIRNFDLDFTVKSKDIPSDTLGPMWDSHQRIEELRRLYVYCYYDT